MGSRINMFNQVNPMVNPAMGSFGWQQQNLQNLQIPQNGTGMFSPQHFMPQMPMGMVPTDPAFMVAHQQAMMIAKQAYQYAVAQQAMAAAADEWERSSNVGSGYAQSAMGGSSVGFGMGGMGMGGWGAGGSIFPAAPRSMYAGSNFGGPASEVGWASGSVYGGSFGPSLNNGTPRRPRISNTGNRESVSFSAAPQRPEASKSTATRPGARPRTNTAPSNSSLPAQHRNSAAFRDHLAPPLPMHGGGRKPPSSWKANN